MMSREASDWKVGVGEKERRGGNKGEEKEVKIRELK